MFISKARNAMVIKGNQRKVKEMSKTPEEKNFIQERLGILLGILRRDDIYNVLALAVIVVFAIAGMFLVYRGLMYPPVR